MTTEPTNTIPKPDGLPGSDADAGNKGANGSDDSTATSVDVAEYNRLKAQLDDAIKSRNKFKEKHRDTESKLLSLEEKLAEIQRQKDDSESDINVKLERAEREKQRLADLVKQREEALDQRVKKAEIQRLAIAAGCLPTALNDFVAILAPYVKTKFDDDGETVFDVGAQYDDLEHMVKCALETRPHMRANTRKGGTGDTGDNRNDSSPVKPETGLPKDFDNWDAERRRAWLRENPEQRRKALAGRTFV